VSDTRRDYRILVAEHALKLLENVVRRRAIPIVVDWRRAERLVNDASSALKKAKYSFMPPSMLASSEEVEKLRSTAEELARMLVSKEKLAGVKLDAKTRLALAETRYALRVLYGLPYRLRLGDDNNPLYAVDIECVEVLSVSKIPKAENLYVTRARGLLGYTIVTNILDVKRGELRAAAILLPREFYGEISEAMYCSKPLSPDKCSPGKRPQPIIIDSGAVEGAVYGIVGKQ
jgi:hypothetical protein